MIILNAVKGAESVILPEVVLNSDNLFLDDMSYAEFAPPAERPCTGLLRLGICTSCCKDKVLL